jgi:hypothetical protein
MSDRYHHVFERLPGHQLAIRQRMIADPSFRSLCEDFDEAYEALKRWQTSADTNRTARVTEFTLLLHELEQDILRELAGRRQTQIR